MTLTLNIPDLLAHRIDAAASSLARRVMEGFAAQSYREGVLSAAEVRSLLGFESRWATEEFLSAAGSSRTPQRTRLLVVPRH
jgi:hypothetical protein